MANSTDIVPGLSYEDLFLNMDATFNANMLYFLLHGIYTGILAITLWTIFTNKSRPVGQVMATILTLIYIGATIVLAFTWIYTYSFLVKNGQNLWTKFLVIYVTMDITVLGMDITDPICTLLSDSLIIWRCWIVWGQRWVIVLLPILLLVSGTVCKCIATYQQVTNPSNYPVGYLSLYSSFALASTLLCTLLIIFRIVTIVRAGAGAGGGIKAYYHVIEVLIESSAIYSLSLILYVAFTTRESVLLHYFDALSAIAKGIAPTLLIGRVAAGHARPDDSWRGSIASSLRFGASPRGQTQTSLQQDYMTSAILDDDLEALQEQDNEYSHHIPAESREVADKSVGSQKNVPDDDPHIIASVSRI
ncbi:hypothetical protein IW261DRAFT_1613476 [Armillaria novae-zelandiae]|uniref:Uncharacterized protein n=1 Tax=Armillaria novae-zelandiae TaxID=153914 RepID=A0AA39NFS7_9AGAR|nr:hypothetical protein IW261DRAFT_1613476 [Armillaria novae-zelandiae]